MTSIVIITLVSLLLSAIFSGMEIAFMSANRLRLEIDRKRSGMLGRIIDLFTSRPSEYITTILVGNNIALVVYSLFMTRLLHAIAAKWGIAVSQDSVIIETLISTLVIIVFGEFTPKSLFRIRPNAFFKALVLPIYVIYIILFPISKFATVLSFALLRLFGLPVRKEHNIRSFGKVDLENLIEESTDNGQKEPENEIKIFQNALDFYDLRVRDCMVRRVDIEAVEIDATIEQLTHRFIETNFSRLFVWRDTIDNIVGYVTTKSLFRNPKSIEEILMPVKYVPETMETERLLGELIRSKTSVAVVIDEFDGTAGVISLEDVLEEIFGEIEDEHDEPEMVERLNAQGELIISGRAEVSYLNEKYKFGLGEDEEYDTLAGYIISHYGSVPPTGTVIESDGHRIKILKSGPTRIELAKVGTI